MGVIIHVSSFVLVIVLVFGFLVFFDTTKSTWNKSPAEVKAHIIIYIIQSVGAILYYIGNNTVYICREYGRELKCNKQCFGVCQLVATICLGGALAYFQVIPPCLKKIAKSFDYEEKVNSFFSAAGLVTIYIKIDALFNTISLASSKLKNSCSSFTIFVTSIFLVGCILLGLVITLVHFLCALKVLQVRKTCCERKVLSFLIIFMMLFVFFPLYMVVDNSLPLNCAYNCNLLTYNSSIESFNCQANISKIRLSFSCTILVTTTLVCLLLFLFKRKAVNREEDSASYFCFNNIISLRQRC